MLGKEKLFEIVDSVIRASESDGVEVVIFTETSNLTRYAESRIHQNLSIENVSLGVRSRFGNKAGVAWTDRIDRDGIISVVRRSEKIAEQMLEDEELPPLEPAKEIQMPQNTFFETTANYTPRQRAEAVAKIIETLSPYRAFGAFVTSISELVIGNSLGLKLYHIVTAADISAVGFGERGGTGWAEMSNPDVSKIDPQRVAERTRRKIELSEDPIEIEPGEYTVIFEPLAVSEFFAMASWLGFSAKSYQEGRSFLVGKLGQKVFDSKLTLVDDPFNEQIYPIAFDYEGVAKQKLTLIENGVAKNLAYDKRTAAKEGKQSTGHCAWPFESSPYASHLVLKQGDETMQSLVESTEKGILVTLLHYVNVVDPKSFTLTGMTRGGTFLIENGKIVKGVKNLRFTQSMFEALGEVEGISREREVVGTVGWYHIRFPYGTLMPAIKVKKFKFTGKTEF